MGGSRVMPFPPLAGQALCPLSARHHPSGAIEYLKHFHTMLLPFGLQHGALSLGFPHRLRMYGTLFATFATKPFHGTRQSRSSIKHISVQLKSTLPAFSLGATSRTRLMFSLHMLALQYAVVDVARCGKSLLNTGPKKISTWAMLSREQH